jgi:DNA polymerase-3 subunit epsilon
MTGGKQFSLGMDTGVKPASEYVQLPSAQRERTEQRETATLMRRPPIKIREEDNIRHQTMMQRITKESNEQVLWREG